MPAEQTDGEITEPENSTVDDWFGQNVARDQEVADAAASEADTTEEAEDLFEDRAEGEDRYQEGHQRPADDGNQDAVGDPA